MFLPVVLFLSCFFVLFFLLTRKPLPRLSPIEEVQLGPSLQIENETQYDVIIVGAGISGISAAHELLKKNPNKSFVLLESRSAVGGTWDLFRYPGIRSDSDMYTLGYSHKPWMKSNPIAPGDEIRNYVKSVAKEFNIDKKISYQKEVVSASYSRQTKQWTLQVIDHLQDKHEHLTLTCQILHMCTGYYDYDHPYTPQFNNQEAFKGKIIHPQLWDETFDYRDKKVVIIGSGATAVTLLPAMAPVVDHITMLQRSPSYILGLPQHNRLVMFLQQILPSQVSYLIIRWLNIFLTWLLYVFCVTFPSSSKKILIRQVQKRLSRDFDVQKHFTPAYNPWEQRLCVAPDADFFKAIRSGKASIVTDHIERFVENGILLKSGEILEADVIITATGLQVKLFGGVTIKLDGEVIDFSQKIAYRGMMFDNLPNFFYSGGYTNASWTLKCELTSCWASRLIDYMDRTGARQCTPVLSPSHTMKTKLMFDLSSGYLQRSKHLLPRQGDRSPWRNNNYPGDLWEFLSSKVNDGVMQFE